MKRKLMLAALALTGAGGINPAGAETTAVNWFTVDAGGGASRGGAYTVEGTIGQADAASVLTGGSFAITPGFWPGLAAVRFPGAPILQIRLANNGKTVLAWPAGIVGFRLEETTSLPPSGSWSATPQPVVDANGEHTVTVPASGPFKIYRLKK